MKRMRKGPRRWKRNSGGDNFRPSNDANRRPKRSCSRHWIPDGARAGRAAAVVGSGGRPCRAAAAEERNVEAASCGAALPSPLPGTASAWGGGVRCSVACESEPLDVGCIFFHN